MKTVFIMATIVIATSACQTTTEKPQYSKDGIVQKAPPPLTTTCKLFVSGTYVWNSTSPIANNSDSIVTEKIAGTQHLYRITRTTTYRKTITVLPPDPESYVDSWTGSFDPITKTMYVLSTGQVIRYSSKNNDIDFNGSVYTKVE